MLMAGARFPSRERLIDEILASHDGSNTEVLRELLMNVTEGDVIEVVHSPLCGGMSNVRGPVDNLFHPILFNASSSRGTAPEGIAIKGGRIGTEIGYGEVISYSTSE